MKRSHRLAALVGGCLIVATAALATSMADPAEKGKQIAAELRKNMEDPAAMQRWQESMQKGPAHEFLKEAFVGEWDAEMRMWMDPKGEPMVAKGSSTSEMILDGRYVREHFKGEMMGTPFTGESTTGYDVNKKQFVSIWIDSMSPGLGTMKGSISPDGKTLTFIGDMDEPMSGEMGKAYKIAITIDSADKHTMEMHEILYGEPFKVMEIVYTRSQK